METLRFAMAALTLVLPTTGQIQIRASTPTGLEVATIGSQSVAPNTDVTAGYSISSNGIFPNGTGAASSKLTLTSTANAIDVTLDEANRAIMTVFMGFYYPYATIGNFYGSSPHVIELELTSAVPMNAHVAVDACGDSSFGPYSGTFTIPGRPPVVLGLQGINYPICPTTTHQEADLQVSPTPTVLTFSTWGNAQTGRGITDTGYKAHWRVRVTNPSPCPGSTFAPACGATLASRGTLTLPGTWIELVDAALPSAALLLVGTQQIQLPIGGCTIYTDFPVLLPFALTAPDRAAVYVPPSGAVGTVLAQGVTVGPGFFHASNGLALTCR